MKFIIGGRQTGKTTKLLFTSDVMGYPIITYSSRSKECLNNLAAKMNLKNVKIYTLMEYETYHPCEDVVLVDDAEKIISKILESHLKTKVGAVTLTNE